ncbi:hypothetical protein IWQ62_005053 [Dispira parvispora]|uniref:C2H2-type domain-containing protein n=1 Tax=Dispira parvispora TaxID=1520584 RepID=A0A9W8AJK7_9FUNG|nr:hypothetical protein IWQ62_005053 [Dispira parvispora]
MGPRIVTSNSRSHQSTRISEEYQPLQVPHLSAPQSGRTFQPRTVLPPLSEALSRVFSPPTLPVPQREQGGETSSVDSFSTSPGDLWKSSRDEPRRVHDSPSSKSSNQQCPAQLPPSKHFREHPSGGTSSLTATGLGNPISGHMGWSADKVHTSFEPNSASPSSRPSAFSSMRPTRTVSPLRPHTPPYGRPSVESMAVNRASSLSPMLTRLPPLDSMNFPSVPGASRTRSSQEQWSPHALPRIRTYSRTRTTPLDHNTYSTGAQENFTYYGHSPSSHIDHHLLPANSSTQSPSRIPPIHSTARPLRSHTLAQSGSPAYPSGHYPLSGSLPTYSSHLEVLGSSASRQVPPSHRMSASMLQQSATTLQTGPPKKEFSFISIPGINTKKRPRRRYEEIERLYSCNWPECDKSYGTLNHLNAHIVMQKHGPKRHPSEFKHIQKGARKRANKEEEKEENISGTVLEHSPAKAISVTEEVSSSVEISKGETEDPSKLSQSGKDDNPEEDILQQDDPQSHLANARTPSSPDHDMGGSVGAEKQSE